MAVRGPESWSIPTRAAVGLKRPWTKSWNYKPRATRQSGCSASSPGSKKCTVLPTPMDKPRIATLPFVERGWDTASYLRFVPELFRSVRNATGPELRLLHDAHHRLTPIEAAGLGRRLEDIRAVLAGGPRAG